MTRYDLNDFVHIFETIPELPSERLLTYARLWQLETWLRYMVYVELRAMYGNDWSDHVQGNTDRYLESDKTLTHMPTPEETKLSFGLFSSLIQTINNEWNLFAAYLPPQKIWDGKMEEIKQIRNRIAHFRTGHRDDHKRVIQLLRDLDTGFFDFCTSLNQSLNSLSQDTDDPVIHASSSLNPYIKREPVEAFLSYRLEVKLDIVRRSWVPLPKDYHDVISKPGFFYDLNIHAYNNKVFHYENLLKSTKSLHPYVLFIILESGSDLLRVLLPSLLGKENLINIIELFIEASANQLWPNRSEPSLSDESIQAETQRVQNIANNWPEFVLGPQNPISFLTFDMPCTFFDA